MCAGRKTHKVRNKCAVNVRPKLHRRCSMLQSAVISSKCRQNCSANRAAGRQIIVIILSTSSAETGLTRNIAVEGVGFGLNQVEHLLQAIMYTLPILKRFYNPYCSRKQTVKFILKVCVSY